MRLTFWEKVWSYQQKERRIVRRIVISERVALDMCMRIGCGRFLQ